MKMGFYLFAEYANMFISSTILAVFFGAYNYPGMAWAVENWGVNIANIIGIAALFAKLCFSSFSTCGCDGLFQDSDTIN
jgi:NADH-quinone oxidoreductase subunit H